VWVTNRHAQIVLASVGIVVDLIRFDALFFYFGGRYLEWKQARADRQRVARGEISADQAATYSASPLRMVDLPQGLRLPGALQR
jgi:hypothetical protein